MSSQAIRNRLSRVLHCEQTQGTKTATVSCAARYLYHRDNQWLRLPLSRKIGETSTFVRNDIVGDLSVGLLAVSTLHHSQPETLGSAFFPHLADAGARTFSSPPQIGQKDSLGPVIMMKFPLQRLVYSVILIMLLETTFPVA